MTMKHSHQSLGIPMPIGKKLSGLGKSTWMTLAICLTIAAAGLYIYQVNSAATKSYTVRHLQKNVDQLTNDITSLEDQSVQLQSMHNLHARVAPLGYIPVDRVQFIDVSHNSYAMAK